VATNGVVRGDQGLNVDALILEVAFLKILVLPAGFVDVLLDRHLKDRRGLEVEYDAEIAAFAKVWVGAGDRQAFDDRRSQQLREPRAFQADLALDLLLGMVVASACFGRPEQRAAPLLSEIQEVRQASRGLETHVVLVVRDRGCDSFDERLFPLQHLCPGVRLDRHALDGFYVDVAGALVAGRAAHAVQLKRLLEGQRHRWSRRTIARWRYPATERTRWPLRQRASCRPSRGTGLRRI